MTGSERRLEAVVLRIRVALAPIVAVADAYVAITSLRPYRAALRASEAMGAVVQGRGRAFDPAVVDALVALGAAGTLPLG